MGPYEIMCYKNIAATHSCSVECALSLVTSVPSYVMSHRLIGFYIIVILHNFLKDEGCDRPPSLRFCTTIMDQDIIISSFNIHSGLSRGIWSQIQHVTGLQIFFIRVFPFSLLFSIFRRLLKQLCRRILVLGSKFFHSCFFILHLKWRYVFLKGE